MEAVFGKAAGGDENRAGKGREAAGFGQGGRGKEGREDMLGRIGRASAECLIERGIVPETKRAVYIYGFEVIYSTCFSLGAILLLGCVGHRTKETLVFLGYFIVIRLFAGGYHAPTYGGCFLVTVGAYGAAQILEAALVWAEWALWPLLAVNTAYIWKQAPVPNPHRRMSGERRNRNRRRARLCLILSVILMAVYQYCRLSWIMSGAVSTLTVISVMIRMTKERGNG